MATPTYEPIASYTFSSDAAFYVFTSIPQTYRDLRIVANVRLSSGLGELKLQYNGDANGNYSRTRLYGADTNETRSDTVANDTSGAVAGITSTGYANTIVAEIQNYSSNSVYKISLGRSGVLDYGTYVFNYSSLWRNTNPITSIKVMNNNASNFVAGSTLTIYGISDAGDVTPKAIGGDVYSDSSYWYHVFTMSGNFVPNQSLTADYLVVAGGGAGAWHTNAGDNYGGPGGGGAGGYRTSIGGTPLSLTNQSYPVIVGAGGAINAGSGSNSSFSTITSAGGGGGGVWTGGAGSSGGSGGGGSASYTGAGGAGGAGNTPSTSPSQGNNGGSGNYDGSQTNRGGGGGGGAGGVGGNGGNAFAGAGGVGSSSASSWGIVTGTGQNVNGTVYYAGGGGGSTAASNSSNVGGYGGGGAGGYGQYPPVRNGIAGLTNTGGGGGSGDTAANGGSGIVIVRYEK